MISLSLEQKLDKIRSPNLQNQRQTASILQAVEETLQGEDEASKPSPTAYFAALLALLTQASSEQSVKEEVANSIVYLLDVVTPFAPRPLLRTKFTQILALLDPFLSQPDAAAPLLRPAIGCLETLLTAQDLSSWDLSVVQVGPRRAVGGLLKLSLDSRPKVRRRAVEALKGVLGSPPPSPSIDHPATAMCAQFSLECLGEVTETWKEKKLAGSQNDAALIHTLQLVQAVASPGGGWPSCTTESLCEQLLSIARDGNEHVTMAVFDVFEAMFQGMANETASAKLPHLLDVISEMRPNVNDALLLPPWLAIFARSYDVAAQVDADGTFLKLPDLFAMVSRCLESELESVLISAGECLVSLVATCIPPRVLLEPTVYDEKILERLAEMVDGLLGLKYQPAWKQTFKVLSALYDGLRWRASPYFHNPARTIGELRGDEHFAGKKDADIVLGSAIRAMGPQVVLGLLPLNLAAPRAGEQGRAWLLSLLRDHTSNTYLSHFRSELVPLSELMFQRALDHGTAEKTTEIKIYETIVQQIWSILPGYCDLPLDLQTSFDQSFAELLANLLYQQVDLRHDICRALRTLVESNQAIAAIDGDEDLVLQSRVTKADASRNLKYLEQFAANFLAVLFNVYSQTLPQSRAPVLETINIFLSITSPADAVETFARVHELLLAALNDSSNGNATRDAEKAGGQALPSTSQTLLDLVITISIYLPRDSFASLFALASLALLKDDQPQLQKKAYKLIPRLASSPNGKKALEERITEMLTLILTSADKVSAPARRERLAAIAALMPLLPTTHLHFIPSVISEVVICCKEHNERTREAAFDLLAVMGQKMSSCTGALIDNAKVPHMPSSTPPVQASVEEYFTMISAGLAGSTPHMISASITALSRVLYEFREMPNTQLLSDLVETMDLFLTSNNREIVKAVLGFVKVAIICLPVDTMRPRLASLVPKLLVWSHEHKGHLRAKVKHILERLIRRFGYEAVYNYCPEADRKLIVNIKKTKERNKRHRDAADREDSASEDDSGKNTGRFESALDAALYSSDDDSARESDVDDAAPVRPRKRGASGSTRQAYIVEDEDEPLDLLGRGALAKVSSTRPVQLRRTTKLGAKMDESGKLILGHETENDTATMEIDTPAGDEETGVGAYVSALRGADVPKRGQRGKLKWSNRNKPVDEEDDGADIGPEDIQAFTGKPTGPSKRARGRPGVVVGRGGSLSRTGRGSIAQGRRGLGQDRRRGPSQRAGIAKRGARSGRR